MKTLRLALASTFAVMAFVGAPNMATASTTTVTPGTTLSATAWETDHDGFSYDSGTVIPSSPGGAYDEYVYRLFDGETLVDVQSTAGYDGLTEAEQTQWYIDAGFAPYEFSWHAFFCLADSVTDPSVGVQSDAGVTLNEVTYFSAEQLFPTASREMAADYQPDLYGPWNTGTLFEVDGYSEEQRSTVGYYATFSWGDLVFATSYVDATCPSSSSLVVAEIHEPGTNSLAVDRELTVPQTLTVEDSVLGEFELDSSGVVIGVTGAAYDLDFNAALWGVTQVDESELSSTGLDVNLGALVAVAAGAVIAGTGILRRRRR
jgi:hypothetical protein